MKLHILIGLLLDSTLAQPEYIKRTYSKFDKSMEPWSLNARWKPHQVSTDDGYILTVFQLIDNQNLFDGKSAGSVLFMNGTFLDAASWFWPLDDMPDDYLPLPIRLLNEGYDVWVTNMRGSTYSTGHSTFDISRNLE